MSARTPIDVRAIAIRFADLWAVDHHQMVDEIYADDIHMVGMVSGRVVHGAAELHALEDRLAELIPEHRHELIRVLVDGDRAFLETMVVGPTTKEYAPAAVWWQLDADSKVAGEIGWFDWALRSQDALHSHGSVPPATGHSASQEWYERFLGTIVDAWNASPTSSAAGTLVPEATVDLVGRRSWAGRDAIIDTVAALAPHTVAIERVLGDVGVIAALIRVDHANGTATGTAVITLAPTRGVTSVRVYL